MEYPKQDAHNLKLFGTWQFGKIRVLANFIF